MVFFTIYLYQIDANLMYISNAKSNIGENKFSISSLEIYNKLEI